MKLNPFRKDLTEAQQAKKRLESELKASEKLARKSAATDRKIDNKELRKDTKARKAKRAPDPDFDRFDREPSVARLKLAPIYDLTSYDKVKCATALDSMQAPNAKMSRAQVLKELKTPDYSFPFGVKVEYRGRFERPKHLALAHPSHDYHLPAEQALLMLAGAHNKGEIFADTLFQSDNENAIKQTSDALQRGAFISAECLVEVISQAVSSVAEHIHFNPGEIAPEATANAGLRDVRDANAMIYRAHMAVASYVVGLFRDEHAHNEVKPFFDKLREKLLTASLDPGAQGVVAGICLAGMMRAVLHEVERGERNGRRAEFIVSCVGAALDPIPFAGKALSAAVTCLAPVVGDAVKDKHRDVSKSVYRIVAQVQDSVERNSPDEAYNFNTRLVRTMQHCEFPA